MTDEKRAVFSPLVFTGGISLFSFQFCLCHESLICLSSDFSLKFFLTRNIVSYMVYFFAVLIT